jgi:hypothetical protein
VSRRTKAEVENENGILRLAILDCWWMARRYADGRMTYATSTYNDHTRKLIALGLPLREDPLANGTVWARDGMGRAFDKLTDAEAAEAEGGTP